MSEIPEVVVLGAGIIGCAIARELARRGARVRIFEARSVAAGATQASAGVLAPYVEAPTPGVLLDLTSRSLAMYDSFVAGVREDSGIEIEYRRCGTLELAEDESAEQRLRGRIASADTQGAGLKWFDVEAVHALEPALGETVRGGLLALTHGYVQVATLTEALAWAAVRHGVEVETHRRITRIESSTGCLEITAEDGQRWTVANVVIATGSWTAQLGLNEPAATAVRPVRGQLVKICWQGRTLEHVLWGADCYVVPWTDGTVLVGATVEDVGFDERTTAAGVRDLLEAVCELLPAAWNATFLEARAGLRPATTDGLPIIGPSNTLPGVVYATGHYRNGVLLAPLTAAIVSDLVLDNKRDPALTFLQPHRFAPEGQAP